MLIWQAQLFQKTFHKNSSGFGTTSTFRCSLHSSRNSNTLWSYVYVLMFTKKLFSFWQICWTGGVAVYNSLLSSRFTCSCCLCYHIYNSLQELRPKQDTKEEKEKYHYNNSICFLFFHFFYCNRNFIGLGIRLQRRLGWDAKITWRHRVKSCDKIGAFGWPSDMFSWYTSCSYRQIPRLLISRVAYGGPQNTLGFQRIIFRTLSIRLIPMK